MENLSLILFGVGAIIGVINWPISILRIVRKSGPSGIPLIGAVFMILGVMFSKYFSNMYLLFALVIDFTCLPLMCCDLVKGKLK